jgi:two-component system, NarL family, invasion response regulator UvrY
MKVLIADDHSVMRQGLKQILAEELPQASFGEAGTVQDTLQLLQQQHWDVLILDIFMPGGDGLEVLRRVSVGQPELPVLVLSSAPEDQLALRVLQAGAAGYLNKQAATDDLVQAIKKVLAGGRYVSSRMAERLALEFASSSSRSQLLHERLSEREFQVLQMLVAGKSLKEIASDLSLSPKTISTFHTRILEKLRLQNDVQLVHYALEHHLV